MRADGAPPLPPLPHVFCQSGSFDVQLYVRRASPLRPPRHDSSGASPESPFLRKQETFLHLQELFNIWRIHPPRRSVNAGTQALCLQRPGRKGGVSQRRSAKSVPCMPMGSSEEL